jgi:hypothetical protein
MDNKISVDVIVDGSCVVTREATESEWDGDDLAYDHEIEGWVQTKDGPYRIDPDKPAWAVYVVYTTGNSFHHKTGVMEVMMVNQVEEMAQKNVEVFKEAEKSGSYYVDLFLDDGTTFQLSNPCFGYHEHVERTGYCEIHQWRQKRW